MRKKRRKKQFGGLISGLFGGVNGFGGGQGTEFLSQIGTALEGFNNEPALSNIFSQSDALFQGFNNQLSEEQREQMGGADQFRPLFDIFSLFSNGIFNRGGFQDGGNVDPQSMPSQRQVTEIRERFGQFADALKEEVIEEGAERNKEIATQMFNAMYSEDSSQVSQIIPGINRGNPPFKKGSKVSDKISLLRKEGKPQNQAVAIALDMKRRGKLANGGNIPVSSLGQFEFPGQPVIVPTPTGMITMDGVNQNILAVQNGGATILPANSGTHQFAPGQVLEIPIPEANRRRKAKSASSRIVNSSKGKKNDNKGISTRIPNTTRQRFDERNRRESRRNKRGNIGLPFGRKVGF